MAVYVHLVWATWDREPLLLGEIERQVHRAIGAKCDELGAEIIALGGVEDHIHLLVELPSTLSVAEFVKFIKGASSRLIDKHVMASEDRFFKWQGVYGAVSVSPQHLGEVAQYIAHQKTHHASGTLITEWEPAKRAGE